jgi:REP element-mobilizing transposase RayT
MGRPLRIEFPGALYHVISRGNDRKRIFLSRADCEAFLELLQESHERHGILIHCYVLMGNHYHLVLETPRGNLVKVMHGINGGYTRYFNRCHKRVGHLFQGRYHAVLVEKDAYLMELSRYVHLNPVRAGIVKKPGEHRWSSYPSYIGRAAEKEWVEYSWIFSRYGKRKARAGKGYRQFVEHGMEKVQWDPLDELFAGVILGSEAFVEEMKDQIPDEKLEREIVQRRRLRSWTEPRKIIQEVASAFGVSPEAVTGRGGRGNVPRKIAIHLVRRYSGIGNDEIGRLFGGLSGSAVSRTASRLEKDGAKDGKLRLLIRQLESKVKT